MAISLVASSAASAISGNPITLSVSTSTGAGNANRMLVGDQIIVAFSLPRAQVLNVYTSAGVALTGLTSTIATGNLNFRMFQRISNASETTLTCSGSGVAADGLSAAYVVLRSAEKWPDVSFSIGSSTSPDSPSVTCPSTRFAVIAAAGQIVLSTVTAPSGFSSGVSAQGSDSRDTTTAIAWSSGVSSSPYDPPVWGFSVTGDWIATSVSFASSGVVMPQLIPFQDPDLGCVEIVAY